jgi:hypothetical protein
MSTLNIEEAKRDLFIKAFNKCKGDEDKVRKELGIDEKEFNSLKRKHKMKVYMGEIVLKPKRSYYNRITICTPCFFMIEIFNKNNLQ